MNPSRSPRINLSYREIKQRKRNLLQVVQMNVQNFVEHPTRDVKRCTPLFVPDRRHQISHTNPHLRLHCHSQIYICGIHVVLSLFSLFMIYFSPRASMVFFFLCFYNHHKCLWRCRLAIGFSFQTSVIFLNCIFLTILISSEINLSRVFIDLGNLLSFV